MSWLYMSVLVIKLSCRVAVLEVGLPVVSPGYINLGPFKPGQGNIIIQEN